ncbi:MULTISPECIES: IPT/TIG domain-containing protein [Myxococcaceae]|uniref:IPT/TIG domain-containing protein n=1 Tax=Myxococcaceae TaxID=31 RepID=UPI001890ADA4|nr:MULTISPECIES: IPT/TIG domain-containing protein [Myxococcaceae]MBF5044192.1 hypothetical protein [Simulacricoccus sp. 17bor-14]
MARWNTALLLGALLALSACDKRECQVDADCEDGNACTVDACVNQVCEAHAAQTDDGNACTADSCDPATGVKHAAISVDDGNVCTADSCDPAVGVKHVAVSVDDGNACTADACDPATGVSHTTLAMDDGNACTADACDPNTGVSHASVPVDDGNPCTADACDPATGVSHTAVSVDDGNACTADACDPATGVSHTAVAVDDGNACTADACDPSMGVSHVAVSVDDQNACTADSCDPATGVHHTAVAVDDGNVCTADSCNPATGVTHAAVSVDDGNACTADTCDPIAGVKHEAVAVDDANACTADSCDPATGVKHAAVSVDDGNACTTDSCDPAMGVAHVAIDPDDSNVCTSDSCDPATGVKHTAVAVDDGNVCTVDSCDPALGVHHEPSNPDDGNACTTDSCDPVFGVKHDAIATDDGNACTMDGCLPEEGPFHLPVDPDDKNACTADSCDPDTGVHHAEVAVDDSNACTTDSCDPSTGVHHDPTDVDDHNACTADACDPVLGTSHTPIDVDDHDVCTVDACDPVTGVSHQAVAVDDGNACTADSCDPVTGVHHEAVNVDDSVACTTDACDPSSGDVTHTPNDFACGPQQVCRASGCVAVGPGDQVGEVVITEFSALGSEFIELHNTTAAPVDIHDFVFQNGANALANVRALNDVNGTAGTPVMLPAGGYLYGVANPVSGIVPAGAGFVYGAIGTSFALADGGDVLSLHSPNGAALEDLVDFRNFITDPEAKMAAQAFPGFAGVSTQLDPASRTAAGNDSGDNWCTSFYSGAPGSHVRVSNTAGAANGSCSVAVINEAFIDPASTDDGKAFLELVGPAGAPVGGLKVEDVEGKGTSAGARNAGATGDLNGTDPAGELTLPAGWRIPADGVLVIADGVNGTTSGSFTASLVPGLGAGDVTVRDMDLENSGGDSIILAAPSGTVWDAVGHDPAGAALDVSATTFKINNLALLMYEGQTAITPTDNVGYALCRDALSSDTDNNRNDFHVCTTPSPGQANILPAATNITSVTPNNTVASGAATTTNVVITGTGLASGATVKFGTVSATCTATGTTQLTCTAPANATVGRVDVSVSNTLRGGGGAASASNAFTYTGSLNGSANPLQADYCNLQFPGSFTLAPGAATPVVYGQLFEAGLTEAPGAPAGTMAQLGYGPSASNPTLVTTWRFYDASYNVQVGNNDEYQGSFTAPATIGAYSYTYRFSFDSGLNWTYCDLNGAGSNGSLPLETTQLGVMTVQ